ncbi:FtsK/SpoIIIE domain-containing protein [Leucobacter sp. USHLN153]|uniref:FtsK/SpoIIIE domain-containing protein n=1 Tax=Leucobacter sp. USHLN153 TaxID=3081268 RepID=UPI003015CE20
MQRPDGTILILDHGDLAAQSGLMSGTRVEPVLESEPGPGERARPTTAMLTVLGGEQDGAQFIAVHGDTLIGRDRSNRVELHETGVSRKHAVLRWRSGVLEIKDLGSSNGTAVIDADGQRQTPNGSPIRIFGSAIVEFGTVRVRVEVGPGPTESAPAGLLAPSTCATARSLGRFHLQSPTVDPVYAPTPVELPSPPDEQDPTRFPLIALLAPLFVGAVLFMTTRSAASVLVLALSPLIMLASWLDARMQRRRASRTRLCEFEESLAAIEDSLALNCEKEREARDRESPPTSELLRFTSPGESRLWSRRPEHPAFLELRLGSATVPSRTTVELPSRGRLAQVHWEALTRVHRLFSRIPGAPVLERLDHCGSLGVAGDEPWTEGVARSLLVQVLALHSPADLVFAAFATPEQARQSWSWLAWLPHTDSAYSPLTSPHLSADARSSGLLLAELEGLLVTRARATDPLLRSRSTFDAGSASARLEPPASRMTPAIVVFVLSDSLVDRARLVSLAERGPDVGIHLVWLASQSGGVPAACRTTVEVHVDSWHAHFVRRGETVQLEALDLIDQPIAETFARELAPIIDAGARIIDDSDLPRTIGLAQLVASDVLGSPATIARNWRDTDSIATDWRPGFERKEGRFAACVGQASEGPIEIDLRAHGPHALVGGTTGSGKSEFLQTWIVSLAANYSPDRITFLLVDYKGGAAFADCVALPHTVGLVTDLNTHLVKRALTSLRAELRYREELLAEKGAKDLPTLERRGDREAPPALVIVIDEFAALAREIPEFVDGVLDIAQRGRSLGLHLIMATQRPAGVISDNLRANTNLRVALRMADASDSVDVIGSNEASTFSASTPGRAAIKIGAGRATQVQTAYLGGRAETETRDSVEICDLGFGAGAPWVLQPELRPGRSRAAPQSDGLRDIEVLVRNIGNAAVRLRLAAPRVPWMDQLPTCLPLESALPVLPPLGFLESPPASRVLTLGLVDEPHLQRQRPYTVDLSQVGNVAVFGGAGSGKTTFLMTAAVAALSIDPATRVYAIDCGVGGLRLGSSGGGRSGGSLAPDAAGVVAESRPTGLSLLPSTGAVMRGEDGERVGRLFRMLKEIIGKRAADRMNDVPVLLLIDGLAAFRDLHEHRSGPSDLFADLAEISASGRNVGVHTIISAERSSGLPAALSANFPERMTLRMTSDHDYQVLGVPPQALVDAAPGRALHLGTGAELQIACLGTGSVETDAALSRLAAALRERGISDAPAVPPLPRVIRGTEIRLTPENRAPFAIATADWSPAAAPGSGLLLVTGPAGSGRTTAIMSLLDAIRIDCRASGAAYETFLISSYRSELGSLRDWTDIAETIETRAVMFERLQRALANTSTCAPPSVSPSASTAPSAQPSDARRVVVIEDVGGFDGTGDESALAAVLKLLRRSEYTTVIEGENATLGAVWELSNALRGARWALALQPDADDVPSILGTAFPHMKRADSPPGRGVVISGGHLTGVHVACSEEG